MSDHRAKLTELRAAIARLQSAPQTRAGGCIETGIEGLDDSLAGGLPKGNLVEWTCSALRPGATTLIVALLRLRARQGQWTALIDGGDRFDPQGAGAEALSRLLWLRCHTAKEAMQSADLLLRDANLSLLLLDLRGCPAAELRRVPSTTWYRFQRILEPTAVALLALTPYPLVPCASIRLELESVFGLEAMEEEWETLVAQTQVEATRHIASAQAIPGLSQAG
jgi:hypothetical protein